MTGGCTGIILTDDAGTEHSFSVLDRIAYAGSSYLVVMPDADEAEPADDAAAEAFVLELCTSAEDENDEFTVGIPDGETADAVYQIFRERNRDRYDFSG